MVMLLDQIKSAWQQFDSQALEKLEPLYDPGVIFIEPAGKIIGREALFNHFRRSCEDLVSCSFEFDEQLESRNSSQASLVWTMHFQHKKLRGGSNIIVPGTTLLQFNDRITLHRDWFDLGATVYENIPLLGAAIRTIKHRLHAA